MLQVLTTPVQPDLHSHVCIHITLPSLVLKSLRWKYAVDWGSLIMLCCVCALQQILMSVQPGKTTAQRTRCASTHMAVSSVSVLTAPKFQTLHTSRHHPCKHRPQSSFYIHVFISVAFDLRCTALRKRGHSAIFLKKTNVLTRFNQVSHCSLLCTGAANETPVHWTTRRAHRHPILSPTITWQWCPTCLLLGSCSGSRRCAR